MPIIVHKAIKSMKINLYYDGMNLYILHNLSHHLCIIINNIEVMKRLTSTLFFEVVTQKGSCELYDIEETFDQFRVLVIEVNDSKDDFKNKYRILNYTKICLLALQKVKDEMVTLSYITKAIALLDIEVELLRCGYSTSKETVKGEFIWTGKVVNLVELLYAICEDGNINGGNVVMTHFISHIEQIFSVEVKDFANVYRDIKHRKSTNTSRTYFLDKLAVRLNQRMDREDNK